MLTLHVRVETALVLNQAARGTIKKEAENDTRHERVAHDVAMNHLCTMAQWCAVFTDLEALAAVCTGTQERLLACSVEVQTQNATKQKKSQLMLLAARLRFH